MEYICEVIEPPAFDSYHKIAFLEEVVRCKDCEYWNCDDDECSMFNCWLNCDGDGFCAWGKRNKLIRVYEKSR